MLLCIISPKNLQESYARMETLAERKYALRTLNSAFPRLRLNQGVDLLKLVSNLDSFSAAYSFDFNEQASSNNFNFFKTLI